MFDRQENSRRRQNFGLGQEKKPKRYLSSILVLLLIAVLIYLLFFSDVFLVKSIKVENNEFELSPISARLVQTLGETRGQNLLFVNTDLWQSRLNESFPELERIVLSKSFPDTLKIKYYKYPEVANLIHNVGEIRSVYLINSRGMVVKVDEERITLPIIRFDRDGLINEEDVLIDSSRLEYMLELLGYFEDKFGMRAVELLYKPNAREVHLLTERNFYLWLDIQKDYENQLRKLKKAGPSLNIYNENFEYIDLRIEGSAGDRIIYKRR